MSMLLEYTFRRRVLLLLILRVLDVSQATISKHCVVAKAKVVSFGSVLNLNAAALMILDETDVHRACTRNCEIEMQGPHHSSLDPRRRDKRESRQARQPPWHGLWQYDRPFHFVEQVSDACNFP
jgi:hypothetical protein